MGTSTSAQSPVVSPVVTVKQVAAFLQIPASTVLLLIKRGHFSYKQVGRRFLIPRKDVEAFATSGFRTEGKR